MTDTTTTTPQATQPPAKLYHQLNPCDIDRFKPLAPVGDAAHLLWKLFTFGTDCTCCLGFRLIFLVLAAFGAGMAVA